MTSVLIGVSKVKLCLQTTITTWWLKTTKLSFLHVVTCPLNGYGGRALSMSPYSRLQANGVFSTWDISETRGRRACWTVQWLLELPPRRDMYHFSFFYLSKQMGTLNSKGAMVLKGGADITWQIAKLMASTFLNISSLIYKIKTIIASTS